MWFDKLSVGEEDMFEQSNMCQRCCVKSLHNICICAVCVGGGGGCTRVNKNEILSRSIQFS